MLKKANDFLGGLLMTIIAGAFLAASLILMLSNVSVPFDPAWITILISGLPMVYLALTRLIYQKWISSALLISIAMVASIAIGELFAAGEVAFIMAIGALLEDKTVERAKKGLSKLISLSPQQGRRLILKDGKAQEETVPITQISTGDTLRVLPGEVVPVDGIIIDGHTSINQSVITGESLPVDKALGDEVFCGTINCFGSIDITATSVGKDSSLQKLIGLVKEAQNKKAPMQRIVDKWAAWLVPIALVIAIIAFIVTGDIVRAVTVLVVFCPCALALATPTSIIAAIGQATKHGVLIKSGEALETMGKVNCIAFDKTGTLTYGKLQVSDIRTFFDDWKENDVLAYAAAAEQRSEHPLGKAVTAFAKEKLGELMEAESFEMVPGFGIRAVIKRKAVLCGNSAYMAQNGVYQTIHVKSALDLLRDEGKAALLVSCDGVCVGVVALSDVLRPHARDMVTALKQMNTDAVLLTGDHEKTALYFAKQSGIASIRSELLPIQKVSCIQELQESGKAVCMIGDGVNDAPALKTASVGIAMGGIGSDIAVEAADIALIGDDITKIPYLKRLSNATLNTIKGNITASMCINTIAIVLSVLGVLNPITGALVHNAGSVLVVLNAALLYDRKFEYGIAREETKSALSKHTI